MENFFVRCKDTRPIGDSGFIYDLGACIENGHLRHDQFIMKLPFSVARFKNMKFDYLLISESNCLYRINKNKKVLEEVGEITDEVLDVLATEEYAILLTSAHVILFSKYFEMIKMAEYEGGRAELSENGTNVAASENDGNCQGVSSSPGKIVWANGIFGVVNRTGMAIYDMELRVVTTIRSSIKDAVFCKKYNRFACALGNTIAFIEPNGLEVGEPIAHECERLFFMKIRERELLVASKNESITIFYMKNFYWYKKAEIKGNLIGVEGNQIITIDSPKRSQIDTDSENNTGKASYNENNTGKAPCSAYFRVLARHYVVPEKGDGFVIDGCRLKYTNFSRSLIPPPYFYKELEFPSQIRDYSFSSPYLHILLDSKTMVYEIDAKDNFALKNEFACEYEQPAEVTAVNDATLLRYHATVIDATEKTASAHGRERIVNANSGQEIQCSTDGVMKMIDIDGSLGILYRNGSFVYSNQVYTFDVSAAEEIDIQSISLYDEVKVYILAKAKLQYAVMAKNTEEPNLSSEQELVSMLDNAKLMKSTEVMESDGGIRTDEQERVSIKAGVFSGKEVFSFILYEEYVICAHKNQCIVYFDSKKDFCVEAEFYIDTGLSLLAVRNEMIIGQSRFGGLEAFTSKVFSRKNAAKLIRQKEYERAASYCDRNHVTYDIFFENGMFDARILGFLSDSQATSLINVLKLTERLCHEYETIARLRDEFDASILISAAPAAIFTPPPGDNARDGHDSNTVSLKRPFISYELSKHLFEDTPGAPVLNLCSPSRDAGFSASPLISLQDPELHVNCILRHLSADKHLDTVVNLFIRIKRIDLCFYLRNLKRVVKVLLKKVSTEDILKSCLYTLNPATIKETYIIAQRDSSPILEFITAASNMPFSVYNYLEDRKLALFHLIKGGAPENEVFSYVKRYSLFDELLLYSYYSVFESGNNCRSADADHKTPLSRSFYRFVADEQLSPELSFWLYMRIEEWDDAAALCLKHGLHNEFLVVDNYLKEGAPSSSTAINSDLKRAFEAITDKLMERLLAEKKHLEAGRIMELVVDDKSKAIKYYLEGKDVESAKRIYCSLRCAPEINGSSNDDEETIDRYLRIAVTELLRRAINDFSDLEGAYSKYTGRLKSVRERLDGPVSMSMTSFSYTSLRSAKKALLKDRPGGAYENEYVLNRIREIAEKINEARRLAHDACGLLEIFGLEKIIADCKAVFKDVEENLREEVDELWAYERLEHDPNRPVVGKPCLGEWFK